MPQTVKIIIQVRSVSSGAICQQVCRVHSKWTSQQRAHTVERKHHLLNSNKNSLVRYTYRLNSSPCVHCSNVHTPWPVHHLSPIRLFTRLEHWIYYDGIVRLSSYSIARTKRRECDCLWVDWIWVRAATNYTHIRTAYANQRKRKSEKAKSKLDVLFRVRVFLFRIHQLYAFWPNWN